MGWTNDGVTTLTIPTGATGARIVIGPDVPADLALFFSSGVFSAGFVGSRLPAATNFTVIGAMLFYDSLGNYSFQALVDGTDGVNRFSYLVFGNQVSSVFIAQAAYAIVAPPGGPTTVLNGSNNAVDRLDVVNALQLLSGSVQTYLGTASTTNVANAQVSTDSQPRLALRADGRLDWGPGGNTAVDTDLYRSGVGSLKTDTDLAVTGTITMGGHSILPNVTVNNEGPVNNFTITGNSSLGSNFNFTKLYANTRLLVQIKGSARSTVGTGYQFIYGFHVNSTDFDAGKFNWNLTSDHLSMGADITIAAFAAGTYVCHLFARLSAAAGNTTVTDANDTWSTTVTEIAP